MRISTTFFSLIIAGLLISDTVTAQKPNTLTPKEKKQDWQLLFDGKTLNGWKGYNSEKMFSCWSVQNGELVCQGEGGSVTAGDIITAADFDNF